MRKIFLSLLLIGGIMLMISLPIFANEAKISDEFNLTVNTDKESYEASDEINYRIELTNSSPFKAENIVLKASISEDLEILDTDGTQEENELVWTIDDLAEDGTFNLAFTAKLKSSPLSIVHFGIVLGTIILLSIALILFKRKKQGRQVVQLLLIVIAATALVSTVYADENKFISQHGVLIDDETYDVSFSIESAQFDLPEFSVEFILPDDFKEEDFFSIEEPILLVNYLSWNDISIADSYTVKKATNDGDFDIISAGLTDLTFIDSEIEQGQTYRYLIEAIYQDQTALITNEITQLAAPILDVSLDKGRLTLAAEEVYGASDIDVYKGQLEFLDGSLSYGDYELVNTEAEYPYEEKIKWDDHAYYYFAKAKNDESTSRSSNIYRIDTTTVDSDDDGLTDQLELELGSDPVIADTNNNGIPDGYEYHTLESDPADMESNVASQDFDEDGLTNLEEYELGTDPWNADTDGDLLSDGDEVNIHGTDPLNHDTDGDGLLDGSEIKLGFDPLKPDTDGNGVLDSEEFTLQEVEEESLAELYTDDNTALPSISIYGQGDINHMISVKDASDNALLTDLIFIEGYPLDLTLENEFDYATISFEIADHENLDEYTIIYYDEGKIHFLDTEVDHETHTISTTVDHFSIYFAAHMPTLEHSWGMTGHEDEDLASPIVERGAADISFVFDTTGSMGGTITNVKENIISFVENMNEHDVDVRLGLVDYKDIGYDGVDSTKNLGWSTDPVGFQSTINSLVARGGGDRRESAVDALEEARRMGYRDTANKYMILVTDVDYKEKTRFDGVDSMETVINSLIDDNVTVIVISNNRYRDLYSPLFDRTSGFFIDIRSDFADTLIEIVDLVSGEVTDGIWVRLSDGTTIKLDKEPEEGDLVTDSNGDGYPDSLQLVFPPIQMDMDMIDGEPTELTVYEFTSNPMKIDTDGDGYRDEIDKEPLIPYEATTLLLHGVNSNVGSVYGAYNSLADGDDSINDTQTPNPDIFGDVENQQVETVTNGRLYHQLTKEGLESVKVYNYANRAYITTRTCAEAPTSNYGDIEVPVAECVGKDDSGLWKPGSDLDFKAYLNNLMAEGEIEAPTEYHKPVINVVAHSMGGLVTRIMYELDDNPPVYLDKLVTWATPHFGTYLDAADWLPGILYDAFSNLDRDNYLYDALNAASQVPALDPNRQFSVKLTDKIDIQPTTEYHFMMGAIIKNKFLKSEDDMPSFILTNDCTVSTTMDCLDTSFPSPGNKEDRDSFKTLVEQNLNNYSDGSNFKVLNTDSLVTLNGGLGYSGKMVPFEDDLGDQLLIGTRTIYAGSNNLVGHSPIHGNKDVIKRTVELLAH